jgi:hypothetical protein
MSSIINIIIIIIVKGTSITSEKINDVKNIHIMNQKL